ncbi:MAG: NYN domain-containing protein [Clostridiales Family XIII bacterium]|nr:NYN domain-containing protein [Clostridiales Family XIII bacterium]
MNNYAFIDGQNLHLGTTRAAVPWSVDLARFRVYLREKFNVAKAYYFLGYYDISYTNLYIDIQDAGFTLIFREHSSLMSGTKKGNVDTDIIFLIMKALYKREAFDKVVLVSGDGDYWRMVDFLIEENRFEKLLAPSKKAISSLYKRMPDAMRVFLDDQSIKQKIRK